MLQPGLGVGLAGVARRCRLPVQGVWRQQQSHLPFRYVTEYSSLSTSSLSSAWNTTRISMGRLQLQVRGKRTHSRKGERHSGKGTGQAAAAVVASSEQKAGIGVQMPPLARESFHRVVLGTAALQSCVLAAQPHALYALAGLPIEQLMDPSVLSAMSVSLGVMAPALCAAAVRPASAFSWVVGASVFTAKLVGPVGTYAMVATGVWSWKTAALICGPRDAVWLLPLALYLYDAYPWALRAACEAMPRFRAQFADGTSTIMALVLLASLTMGAFALPFNEIRRRSKLTAGAPEEGAASSSSSTNTASSSGATVPSAGLRNERGELVTPVDPLLGQQGEIEVEQREGGMFGRFKEVRHIGKRQASDPDTPTLRDRIAEANPISLFGGRIVVGRTPEATDGADKKDGNGDHDGTS